MKTWLAKLGLTAFTAAALLLPSASTYASGSKLYVDDDKQQCKTAQFFKIQDAINAAKPGDTVYVCSGSYAENLFIEKSLTLRSSVFDGQALPLLANFSNSAVGIRVTGTKDVTIRDLRLAGTPFNSGIDVFDSQDVRIQSLTLSDFLDGISVLDQSTKVVVENNKITNTDQGILVQESSSVKVTKNTVSASQESGIHLASVTKSSVSKNTLTDNKGEGIAIDNNAKDNTVDSNTIKNSGLFDAFDVTVGTKTAGKANTWKNNTCATSFPAGLCK